MITPTDHCWGHCFPLMQQPTAKLWWNHTCASFKRITKLLLQPHHCRQHRQKCNNHHEFCLSSLLNCTSVDYMSNTSLWLSIKLFLSLLIAQNQVRRSNLTHLRATFHPFLLSLTFCRGTSVYLHMAKQQRTFRKKVSDTDWMKEGIIIVELIL